MIMIMMMMQTHEQIYRAC